MLDTGYLLLCKTRFKPLFYHTSPLTFTRMTTAKPGRLKVFTIPHQMGQCDFQNICTCKHILKPGLYPSTVHDTMSCFGRYLCPLCPEQVIPRVGFPPLEVPGWMLFHQCSHNISNNNLLQMFITHNKPH